MPIVVETTTFTRTVQQLVEIVLRKLGALGVGETASPEDVAVVREAIDLRLKELHALGALWFQVTGAATDLALTANVAAKSLAAVTDFLYPISCSIRIGTDDYPLDIISHREYQAIQNKSESGDPEKVFFAPSGTAYFWPVQTSALTAKLTYQAIAADTEAASPPDVPVSMMRALAVIVASDLTGDFDIAESKAAKLERQAVEAMKTIRMLNTERVSTTTVEIESF